MNLKTKDMLITRKSRISGKENSMELNITQEQISIYETGEYVQVAFPNLTASEREFIMTGITPTEWGEVFGEEDSKYFKK